MLPTLAGDAKEEAVLDALPDLIPLDMRRWIRLKRQLKTAIPDLNMRDLGEARQELRRAAAQQAHPAAGRSQAHIAAALAKNATTGRLAYDLSCQAWMAYDHSLWKHLETERVTQRIMARMDDVLQEDYTRWGWPPCARGSLPSTPRATDRRDGLLCWPRPMGGSARQREGYAC
jgi:hypothetical protein